MATLRNTANSINLEKSNYQPTDSGIDSRHQSEYVNTESLMQSEITYKEPTMTNEIPNQQFNDMSESQLKKMTGSLRISREQVGKKYVSASVWSRGSLDEPKSAELKQSRNSSDWNKFGSKAFNRRSGSRADSRQSLGSSGISDIEGNSREKNIPFFQRLDNWVWLGYQNEFQLQCRKVHKQIVGREYILIHNRAFWLIILSGQISYAAITIDPSFYTISDVSKWGLIYTWLTFLFSLFATTPQPKDINVLDPSYRNKYFQGWKWYYILFEISFISEFLSTILFWSFQADFTQQDFISTDRKVILYMDHIIPIFALFTEFSLNMVPIVRRHFIIMCFIILAWVLVTICACVMGRPPYPWLEFNNIQDSLIPVMVLGSSIILFYFTEFVSKQKLKYSGGEQNSYLLYILNNTTN